MVRIRSQPAGVIAFQKVVSGYLHGGREFIYKMIPPFKYVKSKT